jgi:hypothetical protein
MDSIRPEDTSKYGGQMAVLEGDDATEPANLAVRATTNCRIATSADSAIRSGSQRS